MTFDHMIGGFSVLCLRTEGTWGRIHPGPTSVSIPRRCVFFLGPENSRTAWQTICQLCREWLTAEVFLQVVSAQNLDTEKPQKPLEFSIGSTSKTESHFNLASRLPMFGNPHRSVS